jgi:hypothetical protein
VLSVFHTMLATFSTVLECDTKHVLMGMVEWLSMSRTLRTTREGNSPVKSGISVPSL